MKLKELRKLNNLTQTQIAEILGISKTGYASWEQQRTEPDIKTLKKLADFYNCSIDYLVGREQEDNTIIVNNDLNDIELKLLSDFRKLNDRTQNLVIGYINGLLQAPNLTYKKLS